MAQWHTLTPISQSVFPRDRAGVRRVLIPGLVTESTKCTTSASHFGSQLRGFSKARTLIKSLFRCSYYAPPTSVAPVIFDRVCTVLFYLCSLSTQQPKSISLDGRLDINSRKNVCWCLADIKCLLIHLFQLLPQQWRRCIAPT